MLLLWNMEWLLTSASPPLPLSPTVLPFPNVISLGCDRVDLGTFWFLANSKSIHHITSSHLIVPSSTALAYSSPPCFPVSVVVDQF